MGWHSLIDHSADVAAVVEALLLQPTIRQRLAAAANADDLDQTTRARLAALAFLHDIGKANRGFQARHNATAPPIGHIDTLAWVFHGEYRRAGPIIDQLHERLGLDRMADWFVDGVMPMLEAVFAHHGRPWRRQDAPDSLRYWAKGRDGDPIGDLAPMREKLDAWFPAAFADTAAFRDTPAFQHAFAGLLMLADWLGSDERFFPFANGADPDRMTVARRGAGEALRLTGLAVEPARAILRANAPSFSAAFGFEPRSIQHDIVLPDNRLMVLEAETGSGKTEAALWLFKTLFERGRVDGLYLALPTRVAATQIFARVKRFRDRIFPGEPRPGVVLAVPGQARFDQAEATPLPDFGVQWSDGEQAPERWAAERPKRFLASPIAVGTIDQALLGAVKVKHAHLRGALLLRNLLVIDEVHASSVYATELLCELLRFHVGAGGYALLLSATLGGVARAKLLGTGQPNPSSAEAAPYPALSWCGNGAEAMRPLCSTGTSKSVAIVRVAILSNPDAVAARALEPASRGAAVLVIRNTVAAAMETARAIEAQAGADSPLLFRVAGIPTLHHSRFALDDRPLLDLAVETLMGKGRATGGGCVVVGTQTVEISLDLDADLLLTDLCPVDVLLQRIGRLHRHAGRTRPSGFEQARTILLVPEDRDLLARRLTRFGLGPLRDGGGIYPDLRMIEATWRLAERHPVWALPAMNRMVVEAGTHPAKLADIEAGDARFEKNAGAEEGRAFAQRQSAISAALDRSEPFDTCEFPRGEHLGTRLGEGDRFVAFDPPRPGPFGAPITGLRLPAFLARGIAGEAMPAEVVHKDGVLTFRLGAAVFTYDRFGVVRTN